MDGDKTSVFHDVDGSVSEYPGSYLIKEDNWLIKHPDCIDVPDWRGSICSGNFAQVRLLTLKYHYHFGLFKISWHFKVWPVEVDFLQSSQCLFISMSAQVALNMRNTVVCFLKPWPWLLTAPTTSAWSLLRAPQINIHKPMGCWLVVFPWFMEGSVAHSVMGNVLMSQN